jgi:hypothetical protein
MMEDWLFQSWCLEQAYNVAHIGMLVQLHALHLFSKFHTSHCVYSRICVYVQRIIGRIWTRLVCGKHIMGGNFASKERILICSQLWVQDMIVWLLSSDNAKDIENVELFFIIFI